MTAESPMPTVPRFASFSYSNQWRGTEHIPYQTETANRRERLRGNLVLASRETTESLARKCPSCISLFQNLDMVLLFGCSWAAAAEAKPAFFAYSSWESSRLLDAIITIIKMSQFPYVFP